MEARGIDSGMPQNLSIATVKYGVVNMQRLWIQRVRQPLESVVNQRRCKLPVIIRSKIFGKIMNLQKHRVTVARQYRKRFGEQNVFAERVIMGMHDGFVRTEPNLAKG